METLSLDDIQTLNQSIQQLYTLQDLASFKVDALRIIDRLVPSDWPLFNLTNARTGKIQVTSLPHFSGLSPELMNVLEQVLSKNRETHPIAEQMPQTLNGAYKMSDFISQEQLHQRENLYQMFLRHLNTEDQMIFFLPDVKPAKWSELAQANTTLAGFILSRDRLSFTERDRLILNLLRPHLFQAYTNVKQHHRLNQNLTKTQQSLDLICLVIVNVDGQIQSVGESQTGNITQATILLETYFVKSTSARQLPDLLWSWVKFQVNYALENPDVAKPCLPLHIQQADKKLIIRLTIAPDRSRYLLLLEEQTSSPLLSALKILGLTQRETKVLALMLQGKDNQSIAIELNIGISTVRKHLENIYVKLNIKSRMEAAAMVLTTLGFFHSID